MVCVVAKLCVARDAVAARTQSRAVDAVGAQRRFVHVHAVLDAGHVAANSTVRNADRRRVGQTLACFFFGAHLTVSRRERRAVRNRWNRQAHLCAHLLVRSLINNNSNTHS